MDHPTSELSPEPPIAYLEQSQQPLYGLVFVAPLMITYELGVLLMDSGGPRNGAEVWLRQMLGWLGLGQYFLLPGLTVFVLLGWHHVAGYSWRIWWRVFLGMGIECTIWAVCLRLIAALQHWVVAWLVGTAAVGLEVDVGLDTASTVVGGASNLVLFLGAGVYEELLFRVLVLGGLAWIIGQMGVERTKALVVALIASSVLFSAAHYVGSLGDPIDLASRAFWLSGSFRLVAGLFFGVLYLRRGFGIAAGAHAGYDLLLAAT